MREPLPLLKKSLRLKRILGSRLGAAWSLVAVAVILAQRGEPWWAARLLEAAKGLFTQALNFEQAISEALASEAET